MKALAVVIGALTAVAYATPLPRTATWDAPTTRENGEPLGVDELDHYTLWELVDGTPVQRATYPGTTVTASLDVERNRCYTLTLTATDTSGLASQPSDPASVCTYGPGKPLRFRLQP